MNLLLSEESYVSLLNWPRGTTSEFNIDSCPTFKDLISEMRGIILYSSLWMLTGHLAVLGLCRNILKRISKFTNSHMNESLKWPSSIVFFSESSALVWCTWNVRSKLLINHPKICTVSTRIKDSRVGRGGAMSARRHKGDYGRRRQVTFRLQITGETVNRVGILHIWGVQ